MSAGTNILEENFDESKSGNEENWERFLTAGTDSDPPVFKTGDFGSGRGFLRLENRSEAGEDNWFVYYSQGVEGESEPLTRMGENPDYSTVDLPFNNFNSFNEAMEYAEQVMEIGVQSILEDYGVNHFPANRSEY